MAQDVVGAAADVRVLLHDIREVDAEDEHTGQRQGKRKRGQPLQAGALPGVGVRAPERAVEEIGRVQEEEDESQEESRGRRGPAEPARLDRPTPPPLDREQHGQDRQEKHARVLREKGSGGQKGRRQQVERERAAAAEASPDGIDRGHREEGGREVARHLLAVSEEAGLEHVEPEGQQAGAEGKPLGGPEPHHGSEQEREDHRRKPHPQKRPLAPVDVGFPASLGTAEGVQGQDGHALAVRG
jgi:hypothetical protein